MAEPLGPGIEPGYWWDFESPGLPRSGLRKGWEAPQQNQEQQNSHIADQAVRQAAAAGAAAAQH